MLILELVVFAVLVGNISAQTGFCAGVCPDGSDVPLPYESLFGTAFTCIHFDQFAKATNIVADCEFYQTYAPICGCPGYEPICPGVCNNGAAFSNQYTLLTANGYYFTCPEMDDALKQVAGEAECADWQNELVVLCGCPYTLSTPIATPIATTTTTTSGIEPAMPSVRVPSSPASKPSLNINAIKRPTVSKPTKKSSSFVSFNKWLAFTLVIVSTIVANIF